MRRMVLVALVVIAGCGEDVPPQLVSQEWASLAGTFGRRVEVTVVAPVERGNTFGERLWFASGKQAMILDDDVARGGGERPVTVFLTRTDKEFIHVAVPRKYLRAKDH